VNLDEYGIKERLQEEGCKLVKTRDYYTKQAITSLKKWCRQNAAVAVSGRPDAFRVAYDIGFNSFPSSGEDVLILILEDPSLLNCSADGSVSHPTAADVIRFCVIEDINEHLFSLLHSLEKEYETYKTTRMSADELKMFVTTFFDKAG
jgi:hypothetical protein